MCFGPVSATDSAWAWTCASGGDHGAIVSLDDYGSSAAEGASSMVQVKETTEAAAVAAVSMTTRALSMFMTQAT